MVRALRVVTVERGVDPRGFALLPFGGAGPMHAAAIAAELGIETILCPRAGGVLSALGLCASERRRDTARTVMLAGAELQRRADRRRGRGADRVRRRRTGGRRGRGSTYEMRYAGQAFELPVPGPARPDPADLVARFEAAHEERYGHRDPDGEVVLVDVGLALVVARARAAAGGGARRAPCEETARPVRFGEEWIETPVLRGEPPAGHRGRRPGRLRAPRGDPGPAPRLAAPTSTPPARSSPPRAPLVR